MRKNHNVFKYLNIKKYTRAMPGCIDAELIFVLELDDVTGADVCAVTAVYALADINASQVVLDGDCVRGALLLALHAADTACITNLIKLCTLIHAVACNHNRLVIGDNLNKLLGADINAAAAADALFAVNLGNAVNDVHCTELAGVYTVAQTDTCEAAVLVALAAEQHGCLAVLGSLVVEALERNAFGTGAGYKCYHLHCVSCGNAHDFADFFSCSRACGNTLVDRSFACGNSSGVTVTAGEAAATAVCACETLADCFLLGVYFNIEYLGGECKYCTENSAENTENDNSK